jgi:hypothetical protein
LPVIVTAPVAAGVKSTEHCCCPPSVASVQLDALNVPDGAENDTPPVGGIAVPDKSVSVTVAVHVVATPTLTEALSVGHATTVVVWRTVYTAVIVLAPPEVGGPRTQIVSPATLVSVNVETVASDPQLQFLNRAFDTAFGEATSLIDCMAAVTANDAGVPVGFGPTGFVNDGCVATGVPEQFGVVLDVWL